MISQDGLGNSLSGLESVDTGLVLHVQFHLRLYPHLRFFFLTHAWVVALGGDTNQESVDERCCLVDSRLGCCCSERHSFVGRHRSSSLVTKRREERRC